MKRTEARKGCNGCPSENRNARMPPGRSRFPGRGGKPRIALFFGPEQAQRREVTVGNRNAP